MPDKPDEHSEGPKPQDNLFQLDDLPTGEEQPSPEEDAPVHEPAEEPAEEHEHEPMHELPSEQPRLEQPAEEPTPPVTEPTVKDNTSEPYQEEPQVLSPKAGFADKVMGYWGSLLAWVRQLWARITKKDSSQVARTSAMDSPAPDGPTGPVSFVAYLKSREFWVTVGLMVGSLAIIGVVVLYLVLPLYTRHNSLVVVPDVTNERYSVARSKLVSAGFDVDVLDSQYVENLSPGAVVSQEPGAFDNVKPGRTIYLVLNPSTPPSTRVPQVIDVNLQQARYMLDSWGLRIGRLEYVSGQERNLIREISFEGRKLEAGDELPRGSRVDLVVSRGDGNALTNIPDVVGMTLGEATALLNANSLGAQVVYLGTVAGTPDGTVMDQSPSPGRQVSAGYGVELRVAGNRPPEGLREGTGE